MRGKDELQSFCSARLQRYGPEDEIQSFRLPLCSSGRQLVSLNRGVSSRLCAVRGYSASSAGGSTGSTAGRKFFGTFDRGIV